MVNILESLLYIHEKSLILDVVDYWPELGNDLTKVIWSHATNSKEKLQDALDGKKVKIDQNIFVQKISACSAVCKCILQEM